MTAQMNWDMLGHEWAVQMLRQHVARQTQRHAYLFTGPQGVGRRTLALRLAQALNCPQPTAPGEACRNCQTCNQIEQMRHPDLAIIQADQIGGMLKVDQIRTLQHTLSLSPYSAPFRVAILLRFEEANLNASNALLKTLEEPPSQVVLVLTAESSEILMPTIVSRCEVLRLRPLPMDNLSQGLQTLRGIPAQEAALIAHVSDGRPGYALSLHNDPNLLAKRNTWLDDLRQLLNASLVERFAYAEAIVKDREALRGALSVWLSFWRDVMLYASGASILLANLDRVEEIKNLTSRLDLATAQRIVSSLERTFDLLERNISPRLSVEVLMLDLPRN